MAFCPKCGKELAEGEVCSCQQQGGFEGVQQSVVIDDTTANPSGTNGNALNNLTAKLPIPENLKSLLPIILGGVVVIILVILLVVSGASAYKKPVKNFEKGFNDNNMEMLLNACMPRDCLNDLKEKSQNKDGSWKKAIKELNSDMSDSKDYLKDTYGRNVSLSINILGKQSVDSDELEDFEDFYNTDEKAVKAYKLKVRISIKGKKDEDSERGNIYVVKFQGDGWKLYPSTGDYNIDNSLLFGLLG